MLAPDVCRLLANCFRVCFFNEWMFLSTTIIPTLAYCSGHEVTWPPISIQLVIHECCFQALEWSREPIPGHLENGILRFPPLTNAAWQNQEFSSSSNYILDLQPGMLTAWWVFFACSWAYPSHPSISQNALQSLAHTNQLDGRKQKHSRWCTRKWKELWIVLHRNS